MTVKELIEKLKKVDQNSHVVVGDVIADDIVEEVGRVKEGHLTHHFKPHPKGKHSAIRFTALTEFSDGVVEQSPILTLQ